MSSIPEKHGEAYSLYCPIPCTAICAELQLPTNCGSPGFEFINFYLGFENEIECGVSRSEKFKGDHMWNRFVNGRMLNPSWVYNAHTSDTLDGGKVQLLLFRDPATSLVYFKVDNQPIGSPVPYANPRPHVKMSVGASDVRTCFYDQVRFTLVEIRLADPPPGAPDVVDIGKTEATALHQAVHLDLKAASETLSFIPMGWELHHAQGEDQILSRMTVPSRTPLNFGNTLPQATSLEGGLENKLEQFRREMQSAVAGSPKGAPPQQTSPSKP